MESTEALRSAASSWSLGGDQQLLDTLQQLHQRIMLKCEETNRKLEEMVTALDDASVNLQNVNNKFTALSNSQFIESRVYDDDADTVAEPERPKEQPKPVSTEPDWECIRQSLHVLESMHESVTILCDSDSDSDDEDAAREVLKPKDLYAHRPLPHIIGSRAWKNKWHAGLLKDSSSDSDSDSAPRDCELYSESEPEAEPEAEFHESPRQAVASAVSPAAAQPPAPPAPAAVAAELARRLGGPAQVSEPVLDYALPPAPTVRKLYKPEKPTPGTIFPDEPPPLDMDQSEESDDDIFAQINKSQPYKERSKDQSSIADDLFGKPIFDDVVDNKMPTNAGAKRKPSLFEDEQKPELFADKPKHNPEIRQQEDNTSSKKPVGGMSLFGSNKNAENIGAAILRRNQRHSSTEEDSDEGDPKPRNIQSKPQTEQTPQITKVEQNIQPKQIAKEIENLTQKKHERDIFDDLFARSEKMNNVKEKEMTEANKEPQKKIDLFSDNLFDDIDDIFTTVNTNVKVNSNDKKQKPIFDNDDDLFTDIAVTKSVKSTNEEKVTIKPSNLKVKSIFDSDEELFSDKPVNKDTNKSSKAEKFNTGDKVSQIIKESKGLFDDSDDELFSDKAFKKDVKASNSKNSPDDTPKANTVSIKSEPVQNTQKKPNLLTEDDKDLFTNYTTKYETKSVKPDLVINHTENEFSKKSGSNKIINSPNLFDDDDEDELFKTTQNKTTSSQNEIKSSIDEDNGLFRTSESSGFLESNNRESKKSLNIDLIDDNKSLPQNVNKFLDNTIPIEEKRDDLFVKPATESKDDNDFDDVENIENLSDIKAVAAKPDVSHKPIVNSNLISTDQVLRTTKIDFVHEDTLFNTLLDNNKKVDTNRNITENKMNKNFKDEKIQNNSGKETPAQENSNQLENSQSNKNIFLEDDESEHKESNASKQNVKDDIFSDIFNDQPPVFEKPKEPKKSKNVNALFDDDSDDEALFLKRNDIVEEKPGSFVKPNDDRIFGIFRDEPPDMDVVDDLVVDNKISEGKLRPHKDDVEVSKPNVRIFSNEPPDFDINFTTPSANQMTKSENTINQNVAKKTGLFDSKDEKLTKDIFRDVTEDILQKPKSYIFDEESKKDETSSEVTDELLKQSKIEEEKTETERSLKLETDMAKTEGLDQIDTVQVQSKKIGKLKPMNFNINVNTLLPGASPKKTQRIDQIDKEEDSKVVTKSNEELPTRDLVENVESKLVKSVSFEGKPESPVLDNTFSKERVKIQVKRRPSTRRARREAVKKSGIDFSEDSTDNSSSVDDLPKNSQEILTDEPQEQASKIENLEGIRLKIEDDTEPTGVEKATHVTEDNITSTQNATEINNEEITDDIISNTAKEVKSKVVYVLNDEDIFNTSLPKSEDSASKNIIDDSNIANDTVKPNIKNPISTLGNVYNKSIFDKDVENLTDSDEDIFKNIAKTVSAKTEVTNTQEIRTGLKKTDSKDDLFKTKSKTEKVLPKTNDIITAIAIESDDDSLFSKCTKKNEPKPKDTMKQNIFEDANDDDALFSNKPKTTEMQQKKIKIFDSDSDEDLFGSKSKMREDKSMRRERKEVKKLQVTGSLFGDDDDDDLFGSKTKKSEPQPQPPKPKVSTKESSKTTEIVLEDPLSLLGSDDD